jgi:hypothetical protein
VGWSCYDLHSNPAGIGGCMNSITRRDGLHQPLTIQYMAKKKMSKADKRLLIEFFIGWAMTSIALGAVLYAQLPM